MTHGAMQAVNVLLRALLRHGGNVVIPTPNFFFDGAIRLAGGEPVHVPSTERMGWAWDLDGIANAVDSQTRAILFSNPTNPTGYLPTAEELDAVIELGRAREALVISDESYDRLVYSDGTFTSILGRDRTDNVVLIRSLSKGYAMANWRVGYIVADPSVIDACLVVFEWESLHCGYVAQRVAAAAIQGPQEWLDEAFLSYQPKRDLVFEAVADNPWLACLRPPSTPFLFVDVSRLPAAGGSPVELMLAAGVPTVPGWVLRSRRGSCPDPVRRRPGNGDASRERVAHDRGGLRWSGSQLTATNGDRKPVSRIAVDIGGTFTDIVVTAGDRVYRAKILSTPPDFGTAVIDGLVGLDVRPRSAARGGLRGRPRHHGRHECDPRTAGRTNRPCHHQGVPGCP